MHTANACTQIYTHTHLERESSAAQSHKRIPIQGSLNANIMRTVLLISVHDDKTNITVKYPVGLNESRAQEPVIVFSHYLSYPNGDRLRRAMPKGHWSLSALPGNGLSVRMGLEGSLRFLPWPSAKSELCRAGLDPSP